MPNIKNDENATSMTHLVTESENNVKIVNLEE